MRQLSKDSEVCVFVNELYTGIMLNIFTANLNLFNFVYIPTSSCRILMTTQGLKTTWDPTHVLKTSFSFCFSWLSSQSLWRKLSSMPSSARFLVPITTPTSLLFCWNLVCMLHSVNLADLDR